jgi:hypothetical protein
MNIVPLLLLHHSVWSLTLQALNADDRLLLKLAFEAGAMLEQVASAEYL